MKAEADGHFFEPGDGDWCLIDLSDSPMEEATKVAHALGLDFDALMCIALDEKLAKLARRFRFGADSLKVTWEPSLK